MAVPAALDRLEKQNNGHRFTQRHEKRLRSPASTFQWRKVAAVESRLQRRRRHLTDAQS